MAGATSAICGSFLGRRRGPRRERATRALSGALLLMSAGWSAAPAQSASHLRCNGILFGAPALIDGTRLYAPYNELGDGQVQFEGTVAAQGLTGQMQYAGYTRTAPFPGVMSGPLGSMQISVLDNTGGRMLIYNGRASLGAPETIGEFVCAWG